MSKLIRIKETTFEKLVASGKWNDTMDEIICRLIGITKSEQNKKSDSFSVSESMNES